MEKIKEGVSVTKKAKGRPTKYSKDIHDDLVYKLVRDNKSNDEIADLLGIGARTFYDWLDRYPSFSQSYKKGLEAKLDKVIVITGLTPAEVDILI